jgi:hypothetical protein
MTTLSFAAMYGLMYAMVDRFANVYNNINQVYMAGLMAAAMVVIELAVMGAMYHSRKLNAAIMAASVVALIALWALIRDQSAVGDQQFLRSMIPHHAGAILMCEQAAIRDPEIEELCVSSRPARCCSCVTARDQDRSRPEASRYSARTSWRRGLARSHPRA